MLYIVFPYKTKTYFNRDESKFMFEAEFKLKNRYINFCQFEIYAIKAAENEENNKKICHIFHHNFTNIPCYVLSEVSLKKVLFCSVWWWTYFKNFEIGVYLFFYLNSSF